LAVRAIDLFVVSDTACLVRQLDHLKGLHLGYLMDFIYIYDFLAAFALVQQLVIGWANGRIIDCNQKGQIITIK
jgi:hypothetical protein